MTQGHEKQSKVSVKDIIMGVRSLIFTIKKFDETIIFFFLIIFNFSYGLFTKSLNYDGSLWVLITSFLVPQPTTLLTTDLCMVSNLNAWMLGY